MKIGFIIFSGENLGGMERRYARLAKYLIDAGEDVFVFCTGDSLRGLLKIGINIPLDNVIILDRAGIKNIFFKKISRILALLKFFVLLKVKNFSHVHIAVNPGLITRIYNSLNKFLPSFSVSVVDSELKFTQAEINSLCGAVAVDCLSQTIKNWVLSRLSNSYEIEGKFFVSPCSFIDYKKVLFSESRDIDIVMVARFVPGKGYDQIRQACLFLPPLNIHLCGFGPDHPRISGAKIYAADSSFLTLSQAKIFLSLQKIENYPSQSLLEAMASGCAVIATDVGETRRLLDESCAILIDSSPLALANAIKKLMDDELLRDRLALSAKERVERLHNIEIYSKYFLINILKNSVN